LAVEQSAQSQAGGDSVTAAKDNGDNHETSLPGALIQLAPGIDCQDYFMSPWRHYFRFGKNSPLLPTPSQGGLGMNDGIRFPG
jgi:hypothetical protein